jgi:hypothetical protein
MTSGVSYNHETVPLDGEVFDDCEFRDCRLVYSGGEPPSFTDCRFADCDWRFEGAAQNTLAHMKVVWGAGGKAQIQALIKTITESGGR